jgi:nicotinamide-nucleotide amidase
MALGARAAAQADIAVSVTGIAGPGGSEHKPEGRVCFAIAHAYDLRCTEYDLGPQGRAQNRTDSVNIALGQLLAALDSYPAK